MADKKKSGISVMPTFIDGEQPTAYKFNTIGAQVKRSSYNLEVAVGDLWDESYPYSTISNTRLSLGNLAPSLETFLNTSSVGRRLDITSIGRSIGPLSLLNPMSLSFDHQGPLTKTISNEVVPQGVREFSLKYPLFSTTSVSFTNDNNSIFTNRVSSANALTASGDYYIDLNNSKIISFSTTGASITINYDTKPSSYHGGISYLGSSFNTIPDQAQVNSTSSDQLIITPLNDGSYLVSLPLARAQQLNSTLFGTTLSSKDINNGVQLTLPIAITLACGGSQNAIMTNEGVAGTLIPEGMIYLRNESSEKVYTDAIYYYNSKTSLKVKTLEELDLSEKYSLITVGSNISHCIHDIYKKLINHRHDREFGEKTVKISSIADNYANQAPSGAYFPSSNVLNNYFSQYLHRDGSRGNDSGLNDDNAMRGSLVIGRQNDVNGNAITSAGQYTGNGNSFGLFFSRNTNETSRIFQTENPYIQNLNIYSTSTNKTANMVLNASNNLYGMAVDSISFNQTSASITDFISLNASGQVRINSGFGVTINADTNYITNKAPIFVIDSPNNVNGYAQAADGLALGNYVAVEKFWDSGFDTASANGLWYVPQLKTISFRQTEMKFTGYQFGSGNLANDSGSTDYWQADIELPENLSHGPNATKVNGVNITSPMIIMPHMISCVVRRSNSPLQSASWWMCNTSTYVQGSRDFHSHSTSGRDVQDSPMANIVGMLMGSAYNYGETRYRIMMDADELYDLNSGAPNDFSKYWGTDLNSGGSALYCDVILTIWYIQGEYP